MAASSDERLAAVQERLAGAVESLVSGDDWTAAMAFAAKFRSRSFSNALLIWRQHADAFAEGRVSAPDPSYVAGYKQWQALGRQVDKGQSGYVIFAPVTARFAAAPGTSEWRRLSRGEKPLPGERVESKMIGARPAYVWDVSQTSGDPIPEPPAPVLLAGQAPAGLREGLEAQIAAAGFTVEYVDSAEPMNGANGITDYGQRLVQVRTNMDDAAQVKTLAHELGHVLLHDPKTYDRTNHHRGIGEVEAESFAMMIGAAHGMDTADYTVAYVANWANTVEDREPHDVVIATGNRVMGEAKKVLDGLDTAKVPAGDPPGLDAVRETARTTSRKRAATRSRQPVAPAHQPVAASTSIEAVGL